MKSEYGVSTIDILTATLVVCGLVIGGAALVKPLEKQSIAIPADQLMSTIGKKVASPSSSGIPTPDSKDIDGVAISEARSVVTAIESLAAGYPGGTLNVLPTTQEIIDDGASSKFSANPSAPSEDNISTTIVFFNGTYTVTSVSLDGKITRAVLPPKVTPENKNAGDVLFSSPVDNPAVYTMSGSIDSGLNGTIVLGF